jgi:hypothetical protein
MPRVELRMRTALPPERLMGAMLDFTEARPELWPRLSRKFYEVYEVGETFAVVKEGTAGPPFSVWARERYDWSTPWKVSWTVEESNFCTPGSGVVITVSSSEGGGSDVLLEWQREPTNPRGRIALSMVARNGGKMLRGLIQKAFSHLERQSELPGYRPPSAPA